MSNDIRKLEAQNADEMDEGEMWAEYRQQRQEKKRNNIKSSLSILEQKGIEYKTLNAGGAHYRVGDYDFWPSTGKFYNAKTGEKGRGVFNLLKALKK